MRNKDKITSALSFLDQLLEARKQAIKDFKKGGQNVTFDMVSALSTDEFSEIATGVHVKVVEKTENYMKLYCRMIDKAELNRHCHSDYDERFYLEKGKLFDIETKQLHEKEFVYKAGQWHNLVSVGACEMTIICIKVPEVNITIR